MRSIDPLTRRAWATLAVAALVPLLPESGLATAGKHGAGTVDRVLQRSLLINGKHQDADANIPLNAGDRLFLQGAAARVRFTVGEVQCTFWSGASTGNIVVQPQNGVSMAFNGGTTLCSTPLAQTKHAWHAWLKKKAATLKFAGGHDPLFTIVVGKASSIVRVWRGALIVGGNQPAARVVVGRNQQVAIAPTGAPSQPTATGPLSDIEKRVLGQVESNLPPVKDNNRPTTTFGQKPHDPSSLRWATFTFDAQAGSTFSCSLEQEPFHVCRSPLSLDGPLAPGAHVLRVQATDPSGNVEKVPAAYTWHVDASRIAFESTRSGNADIYVMDPVADPAGKNAVDVTNDPAGDHDPAWSPDGKRIAFHSDRSGVNNIYVVDANGGRPVQVTHDATAGDTNPTWSPDGLLIAYEHNINNQREIWVTGGNGQGRPIQLTSNPGLGFDANFDPAWSPKGNEIAFASTRDGNYEIYGMDANGKNQTRLTNDSAVEFNPAWSPDGSQIAFHSDINRSSKQIWVMNADGKGAHQVLSMAAEDGNPTWAPDGAEIAFQSGPPGDTDIYVVGTDGKRLTRLTFAAGPDTVPDWR